MLSSVVSNSRSTNLAYSSAKKALNASAPDRVVAREAESAEIRDYLVDCFESKKSMSLYVNGQPGTGKTLCVTSTLDLLKEEENYKFNKVFINCMSIKSMANFYKVFSQELATSSSSSCSTRTSTRTSARTAAANTPSKKSNKENSAKTIESTITTAKHHLVLILDEIDQIETSIKSSTDLYRIFNWPFLSNSKLILIGIANSLDFTDRLLPRLDLTPDCKPKLIKFMPYSKENIIRIIKDRLKDIRSGSGDDDDDDDDSKTCTVIDDRALTLCASKIASSSGDIRKVLDICRRAIEMIEQDIKKQKQQVSSTPSQHTPTTPAASDLKVIGIAHMMKVFNEINPMTNSNLDRGTMPLMQKILLCTILLCNKDLKLREIALSKLFEKFNKICKTYASEMDSESEFINLCTMAQDNGLVTIKKNKDVRNTKISLGIDELDLKDKLQDENFMADILTNKLYK